jgi:predicted nucleic acid-binding protein
MRFTDIPAGAGVFLDANTLLYHFTSHPRYGAASTQLVQQIEQQIHVGYTSTNVLGEVVHRLMTLEAIAIFGWPARGIAQRLRQHPAEVQQLADYRRAIDEVSLLGIKILPIPARLVWLAADVIRNAGLLSNDALIVATMQDQGLIHLASNDADFDRVPGLTRYAPL